MGKNKRCDIIYMTGGLLHLGLQRLVDLLGLNQLALCAISEVSQGNGSFSNEVQQASCRGTEVAWGARIQNSHPHITQVPQQQNDDPSDGMNRHLYSIATPFQLRVEYASTPRTPTQKKRHLPHLHLEQHADTPVGIRHLFSRLA